MKKIFLTIILIAGFTIAGLAQNAPQTKAEAEKQKAKQTEQMVTACKTAGLTEEEIGKVKAIIADMVKKQAEIKNDATLSDEARKSKLKETNSQKDWKIQDLMGKDRYKVYADTRKQLIAEEAAAKQKSNK